MAASASEPNTDPRRSWVFSTLLFIALLASAIALGGALAHLFELPNKIGLPRDQYFTVQKIYDGWWQFAYVLVVQAVSMVSLLLMTRTQPRVRGAVLLSVLALAAAQIVFWVWTQPANVATENWRTVPENWEVLRRQWELSHAAGAVLQLVAFMGLVLAALTSRKPGRAD